MKEIVIISGKGGTGKTSITASFAYLGGEDVVVADCDVDAADMHLLLSPDFAHKENFYSGNIAQINQDLCIRCGKCKSICRFDAIPFIDGNYFIDEINCEGCGYCSHICESEAINMKDNLAGQLFISTTRLNNTLVHAELRVGAENSGKLVTKVRTEAKRIAIEANKDYVIIDGTPGIGCPVIASITGVDYVVVVTEPTVSGFHDMKRVFELINRFEIKSSCIINKADLNQNITEEIKHYLETIGIDVIAELPYDNIFVKSLIKGKTVVENNEEENIKQILHDSWNHILEKLK